MTALYSREEVEALPAFLRLRETALSALDRVAELESALVAALAAPLMNTLADIDTDLLSLEEAVNRAEAAETRIAELERERDVCIKAWQLADSCTVQERERTAAAKAQVARLRTALEPFAESHDKVPRYEHVVAARTALGET